MQARSSVILPPPPVLERAPSSRLSPQSSWSDLSANLGTRSALIAEVSSAEHLVFAQLLRGLSNKEIAAILGKSTGTVKNQVASILRKTGAPCRRQLIVRAYAEPATFDGTR